MNRPDVLHRARRDARRLLKDVRSDDPRRVAEAIRRFSGLRSFSNHRATDIPSLARLKHALALIAEERGFESWLAYKRSASMDPPPFHAPCLGGFLFRWFSDPREAAASQSELGGFVLPFGQQCFVCEADAIREIGLDPKDPDWAAVGFDLVQPRDTAAAERLFQKRRAAIRRGIGVPASRRQKD